MFEYSTKNLWRIIWMNGKDDSIAVVLATDERSAKTICSVLTHNYSIKPKRVK
jgi:hypothetical protein